MVADVHARLLDRDVPLTRASLAELDDAPTSREHWKILLTSGMGFFTDAYDLFVIGVVATLLSKGQWHIASYQKSLVSSLALLTSAAGAIAFGAIADRLGRRKIYGLEVLVLAAGAIASALSPSIWWLIGFRAVLGFGIGGDYPVSATIMSEYAGKRHRGRMVSLVCAMQGAGLIVGPTITIILLESGLSEHVVWRLLLAFGAVPALAVFWLRRHISETPRFRVAQQEAAAGATDATIAGRPTGVRGVFADRTLLRWLIGASLAWCFFDFAYYDNTISSPLIVKLVAPQASEIGQITYTLVIFAVAALPGYLIAAWTIDRLGRRSMQVWGFVLIAAAFFCIWLVPNAATAVSLFLILFGATYFFSEFGPNTTTFVYPAEIFPVQVRTTSHGIAAAAGKIGAFIGTYALTSMLPRIGVADTSGIVGAVAVLGAVTTMICLPEPKGKSLEAMVDDEQPPSAVALGLAESRALRPPAA